MQEKKKKEKQNLVDTATIKLAIRYTLTNKEVQPEAR